MTKGKARNFTRAPLQIFTAKKAAALDANTTLSSRELLGILHVLFIIFAIPISKSASMPSPQRTAHAAQFGYKPVRRGLSLPRAVSRLADPSIYRAFPEEPVAWYGIFPLTVARPLWHFTTFRCPKQDCRFNLQLSSSIARKKTPPNIAKQPVIERRLKKGCH